MKQLVPQRPVLTASVTILIIVFGIVLTNILLILYRGQPVPVPDIPRQDERFGSGEALSYVVFGDSTTVAQGSDYDSGYVRASARYLASRGYAVTLRNFGVSGARAADIPARQIPRAQEAGIRPDIVLLAVTANDVTHATRLGSVEQSLTKSIEQLRKLNPNVRIILTGAPQMGTVPRFPWPAHNLARARSDQINHMVQRLAIQQAVLFAPIADKTGPQFAAHPEYYAADLFHPNKAGYAVWTPVITRALDTALAKQ